MKSKEIKGVNKESLSNVYGPLIGGKDLVKILGFRKHAAFRQAIRLNRLGINTFDIENRRGKFALTEDVEKWLEALQK